MAFSGSSNLSRRKQPSSSAPSSSSSPKPNQVVLREAKRSSQSDFPIWQQNSFLGLLFLMAIDFLALAIFLFLGLDSDHGYASSASAASPEGFDVQITYGTTLKLMHERTKFRLHSHDVPYSSGSWKQSVTRIFKKLGYGSTMDLKGIQVQRLFLWFDVDEIWVDLTPDLEYDYYRFTCPQVESIIRSRMAQIYNNQKNVSPTLLHLFFHDCFIQGCAAFILLDDSHGNKNQSIERQAVPNRTLRGFDKIDLIKEKMEKACLGVVSCAHILAHATRDGIVIAGDNFINFVVLFGSKKIEAPVLFQGVGHTVNSSNSLVLKLLSASPLAYSANPKSKLSNPPLLTKIGISLVSVLQKAGSSTPKEISAAIAQVVHGDSLIFGIVLSLLAFVYQ